MISGRLVLVIILVPDVENGRYNVVLDLVNVPDAEKKNYNA